MALTDWAGWEPRERAVLVFLRDGPDLLLIHKKRGLGTGKVNAPGGRLESGETWEQAGIRETTEETGLTPEILAAAADLSFQFTDGYSLAVRVFLARGWSGTLTACDEADPFWHPALSLPWESMWADDSLWLRPVLAGRWVTARYLFEGEAMREARMEIRGRPPGPIDG
jgi:8-oxo-dGTP diphosphatase